MLARTNSMIAKSEQEAIQRHIERVKLKRAEAQAPHGSRTRKVKWNHEKFKQIRDRLGYGVFDRERERIVSLVVSTDIVTEEGAAANVPVWKQGDLQQYTDEALKERAALRTNKEVVERLEKFWQLVEKLPDGRLDKKGYTPLSRRLYRALVDAPFDEDDCSQSVDEDWKEDARGKATMTHDVFINSMFQLVDTWTTSTREREYIGFLDCILRRISEPVPTGPDEPPRDRFRPEKSIEWLPIHENDAKARAMLAEYASESEPEELSDDSEDEMAYRRMSICPPLPELAVVARLSPTRSSIASISPQTARRSSLPNPRSITSPPSASAESSPIRRLSLDRAAARDILRQSTLLPLSAEEKKRLPKLMAGTHFDMQAIELIARQFKTNTRQRSVNSQLTISSFTSSMSQWGVGKSMIKLMFDVYDVSGKRGVDIHEYVTALSVFLRGTFQEKVKLCFVLWDKDRSGSLSESEIRNMLQTVKGGGPQKELEDDVEYVMRRIDLNEDGLVSLDEFQKGVNRVPVLNLIFRRCFEEAPL